MRLGDVVPDDVIAYYWESMPSAERERLGVASRDALRDYQVTGAAVAPYFTTSSPAENAAAVRIITDPREIERRLADARSTYPSDDVRRWGTEAIINARVPALHIPSGTTVRQGDVFRDELIVDTWDSFIPVARESMRQRTGIESPDDFRDIRATGPKSQMRWMSPADSSQFFAPRFLRSGWNHWVASMSCTLPRRCASLRLLSTQM